MLTVPSFATVVPPLDELLVMVRVDVDVEGKCDRDILTGTYLNFKIYSRSR
jgi:hypothetical protein